jgi:Xaa-Pro dipeptidase
MFKELYGDHVKEMQGRWEAAMLAHDCDAILLHAGTPLISFLDDYEYAFRSNPHFLAWLPLSHHHDSVLLIRPGERPLLWFYQPQDYWYSAPADPESWWADYIEVRVVSHADAWRAELPVAQGRMVALGDAPALAALFPAERINPLALLTTLHIERTRKTGYEVACMSQANQQAALAHVAAERAFRDGKSEFDIHLAYLHACRQNDPELPYNSIVALNHHGAVLHYQQRERLKPAHRVSFLIDAGSTVHAYAADVTRSYAALPGEFADLISAMDNVQQGLAGQVRAGLDFKDLHLSAHLRIAEILLAAGIVTLAAEDAVATGLSSVFFPHGLGHFIGLQTHDVAGLIDNEGQSIARPDGHPFLRLTRKLEAGNVVTIEPGVYFIEPLLSKWRAEGDATAINWDAVARLAPCGGIRIEDNVLVTAMAGDNLTRKAFASL